MLVSFAELKLDRQPLAGRPGSTLARLYQRRFPVPEGFVLLPAAFEAHQLKPEAWALAQSCLAQLRGGQADPAFTVHASPLDEGAPSSVPETVMEGNSDEAVRQAIDTLQHAAKAAPDLAVVIQRRPRTEIAGVLYTANPDTGDLMHMTGRLGAKHADAQPFIFDCPNGRYHGPPELKRYARQLYQLAVRLDRELAAPQEIGWAAGGGKVYLWDTRPILSLREFNPVTGELNASRMGDFLWSNGNAAEIQPEVMTLLTWSVGKLWGQGYGEWWSRYPASGNIGGRNYFNISIQVAPFASVPGLGLRGAMRYVGDWWGRIPPGVTVPLAPFSIWEVLFKILPMVWRSFGRMAALSRRIPEFVDQAPDWCRAMRARIRHLDTGAALAALWRDELRPYYCFGTTMAGAANSNLLPQMQNELRRLVGEADANALLSNLGGQDYLASLGPVVNLGRVARGELSREAYLEQYGHRGPYEFELAQPQPAEDTTWLDQQLADFARTPVDVEARLNKQRAEFDAAWQRFAARYPGRAGQMQRRLAELRRRARQREAARSEATRVMGVLRAFALRAGALAGLGEDVFQLTIDELLAVLDGDKTACRYLPARQEMQARYRALPPYPAVISGRFDPFQWAADPARRSDVYDAHVRHAAPASDLVTGFAGAAGVVEGIVRRIDHAEDGHLLRPGEILVTTTTNVGWTPLFPRAAAVVTDVGAPLSHAAIVARELGLPAVVGCNDATLRLKTGDRVRVNGGRGTVEILARADDRPNDSA